MEYKPKVITGKVTGTGWPIDGHVLWFSQWDYDNRESWHLYGWEDSEDEAVMQTVFQTETEAGLCRSIRWRSSQRTGRRRNGSRRARSACHWTRWKCWR